MASRKPLKSVTHNLAHSFSSPMNYTEDDYFMSHLLKAATRSGIATLEVDLINRKAAPRELLVRPVAESVQLCCRDFPDLVRRTGSDPDLVIEARLDVTFRLPAVSRALIDPPCRAAQFICTCRIVDDRRVSFESRVEDVWRI